MIPHLLLVSEARQETRPSDLKLVTKTYYYIDFKLFVDVVKYKMYMMKRGIEDLIKNVKNPPLFERTQHYLIRSWIIRGTSAPSARRLMQPWSSRA